MIEEMDIEKGRLEHMHSDILEMLKEHVTMQVVDTLTEKSVHAKKKLDALSKKFHTLEKSVQEEHTA
jgi:hypothetical protein